MYVFGIGKDEEEAIEDIERKMKNREINTYSPFPLDDKNKKEKQQYTRDSFLL